MTKEKEAAVDFELTAMSNCWRCLDALPYHAKERVLGWLTMKMREEPPPMTDDPRHYASQLSQAGRLG